MPPPGLGDQQRALAEIVEQQGGQDEGEPDLADRLAAEVPQVRVQRLAAGGDEKHGVEDEVPGPAVVEEELNGVPGIDRQQYLRRLQNAPHAEQRKHREPDQRQRPEHRAHRRRAVALHREQREQDHHRDRNHILVQCGAATCRPSTALSTEIAGVIMAPP